MQEQIMTANVLQFPKSAIVREAPQTNIQLEQLKEKGMANFADGLSDDLLQELFLAIDSVGLDATTPEFERDFSVVAHTLKATIYRTLGLSHDWHETLNKIDVRQPEAEAPVN